MDILGEGLLGAIIGGAASLAATYITLWSQKKKAAEEDRARVKAVLQAIHVEIRTLCQLYDATMPVKVHQLAEGQPLRVNYPIAQDYFTIYRENSHLIGHIPDAELRSAIVACYMYTKSLVDTYRFNNDLVDGYDAAELAYKRAPTQPNDEEMRARLGA